MPELPEVETIPRCLLLTLPGRIIRSAEVREPRLRVPVDEDELNRIVSGRRVTGLSRRAKYLIVHLESNNFLVIHLGLSGRVLMVSAETPLDKHDHVIFELDDGRQLR